MKRLRKLLLGLLGAFVALGFLAVGVAGLLATTESGTRFLFAQAERLLPIDVEGVSGTLDDELHVDAMHYRLPDQIVEAYKIDLAISLWPLLTHNRVQINALTVARVSLRETTAVAENAQPAVLEVPALAVDLVVETAHIGRAELAAIPPFALDLAFRWQDGQLKIRKAAATAPEFIIDLQASIFGTKKPRLQAQLNWSLPPSGWSGHGSFDGPVDKLHIHHEVSGDYDFVADGNLNVQTPARPLVAVDIAVVDFAVDDISIQGLVGTVSGGIDQLQVHAQGSVANPWIDPVEIDLRAQVTADEPATLVLHAEPLSGQVDLHGHINWQQDFSLILNGRAEQLALDELYPDLTGQVGSDIAMTLRDELLSISVAKLGGKLEGRPVSGAFNIAQTETGWSANDVALQIGTNALTGNLSLAGESITAQAEISAPQLSELGLDVEGDLVGSMNVAGTWPALNGSVQLRGDRINGLDISLAQLTASASMRNGTLTAALTAASAAYANVDAAELSLSLNGVENDLAWALAWKGGNAGGRLLQPDQKLVVRAEHALVKLLDTDWSLASPVELNYSSAAVSVSPFCITGPGARACVSEYRHDAQTLATSGILESLPIALFARWLPFRLDDSGMLQGSWQVANAAEQWSGNATLQALQLALVLPDSEEAPIELPDATVSASLQQDQVTLSANVSGDALEIVAKGEVTPVSRDGVLSGSINLSATDLTSLRAFDQRILEADGQMSGQVALSGTLLEPRAAGRAEISGGTLTLRNPDILLTGLELAVDLDDRGRFAILGNASQPNGAVRIQGSGSNMFAPSRVLNAELVGEGLQAEHPAWKVTVSPSLLLAYASQHGHVSGTLSVPNANIKVNTLPASAPRISADVEVRGRNARSIDQPVQVTANVDLILGDDVVLKAVGVTAELTGKLNARVDERGRTALNGTLEVAGGALSAQGQSLKIESGVVVYDGPVADPYLDLRAVRQIENQTPSVKVGVHIRGRANNLTSSVFAEPSMSDTRALSFLILGRDFDEKSEGDGNKLASAAINLGLQSSKSIIADVRRFAGLDELSAMAESQDSFAIVAGKRIGPSLYVRYTYDTLAALGAILVRYNLTGRWHLEAQSSTSSAMDLFYSIEK